MEPLPPSLGTFGVTIIPLLNLVCEETHVWWGGVGGIDVGSSPAIQTEIGLGSLPHGSNICRPRPKPSSLLVRGQAWGGSVH